MSAVPLKADMCSAQADVRLVPIADVSAISLDYRVGATTSWHIGFGTFLIPTNYRDSKYWSVPCPYSKLALSMSPAPPTIRVAGIYKSDRLVADERTVGANRLRWYIHLMTEMGERDPSKIARSALGMTRQYEQITRSKARVALSISPAER